MCSQETASRIGYRWMVLPVPHIKSSSSITSCLPFSSFRLRGSFRLHPDTANSLWKPSLAWTTDRPGSLVPWAEIFEWGAKIVLKNFGQLRESQRRFLLHTVNQTCVSICWPIPLSPFQSHRTENTGQVQEIPAAYHTRILISELGERRRTSREGGRRNGERRIKCQWKLGLRLNTVWTEHEIHT